MGEGLRVWDVRHDMSVGQAGLHKRAWEVIERKHGGLLNRWLCIPAEKRSRLQHMLRGDGPVHGRCCSLLPTMQGVSSWEAPVRNDKSEKRLKIAVGIEILHVEIDCIYRLRG